MATVYTKMKNYRKMCLNPGQEVSLQTMDQQLYAIAHQVKWCRPEQFKMHNVRIGGFHILSCFISAIGKLWGDGGLRDLLVDSNVYAGSTADLMLAGKQFHLAVRGLTLLYEALSQLLLSAFFDWCEKKENVNRIPPKFWRSFAKAQTLFDIDQGSCLAMVKKVEYLLLQHVLSLFKQFKKWGETQSPTFAYCVMLLDSVQLMLLSIRSERQSNWTLHMHTVASMLPYFFVTNRTNYSRWIPDFF